MRKSLIALLALAVLTGLGVAFWKNWDAWVRSQPSRLVLLGPSVEGLPSESALGVWRLLEDEFELQVQAPVIPTPDSMPPGGLQPTDTLVRFSGRREGDLLALKLEWIRERDRENGGAWHAASTSPLPPSDALRRVWEGTPWSRVERGTRHLLPATPEGFWELVRQSSIQEDVQAASNLEAAQRLAEAEPQSAAVWCNLGEMFYRVLWTHPEVGGLPQNQAGQALNRALVLTPDYPRAAILLGMLDTDIGDQREGLRVLTSARSAHPGIPNLYSGLAYAGRTAGLLDGALRALAVRDQLVGSVQVPEGWFVENTYLYSGRWDSFRRELSPREDPIIQFYSGYLDLLEGRREAALRSFQLGAENRRTSLPFSDLCAVYALALQGRNEEALTKLREFETSRGQLRIPDGELTFKVAEAYAFLGQTDEALTVAGRAFAQGFGCLAWYDRSPILAPARKSLKWQAFRAHIQERQSLLERNFPSDTFG